MRHSKTGRERGLARQFTVLLHLGTIRDFTDGQLLERFTTGQGEAAEHAFAALVERHTAMVLRVCRAHLVDRDDAQDAFQATFLILVKKARGLWVRESLGPWLHQVAVRTASSARASAQRRRRLEHRAAEQLAARDDASERESKTELERALHEEIDRLPERYRIPIVLCDLEGHTCEEAARRMSRPIGTVKSWRSRARERLRARLIERGLAPSPAPGFALAETDSAARSQADQIASLALLVRDARMITRDIPASVLKLAQGVLQTMLIAKLRMTAAALLALTALTVCGVAAVQIAGGNSEPPRDGANEKASRPTAAEVPQPVSSSANHPPKVRALSLREAMSLGIANGPGIQVIRFLGATDERRAQVEIASKDPNTDSLRFKADAMAHIRSIEQQYWQLAQHYFQLAASEKAFEFGEVVLLREQSELDLGRGNPADLAEAQRQLDRFRLELATKTSDVIASERQLRYILGLPLVDGQRIAPITPPTETLRKPDWEPCLATMLEKQPDILRAKAALSKTDGTGTRSRDRLERQRALQVTIDQATSTLARLLLDIAVHYKEFQMASRLLAPATERLELQRASYEQGRVTTKRFLDIVSQYATSRTMEAHFKMAYNVALTAFEEAQGTLLEREGIIVVKNPARTSAPTSDQNGQANAAPNIAPASTAPVAPRNAPQPEPKRVDHEQNPNVDAPAKTFSFQMTIGTHPQPVEIRASITIAPTRSTNPPKPQ